MQDFPMVYVSWPSAGPGHVAAGKLSADVGLWPLAWSHGHILCDTDVCHCGPALTVYTIS